jgi:hypothetical protein
MNARNLLLAFGNRTVLLQSRRFFARESPFPIFGIVGLFRLSNPLEDGVVVGRRPGFEANNGQIMQRWIKNNGFHFISPPIQPIVFLDKCTDSVPPPPVIRVQCKPHELEHLPIAHLLTATLSGNEIHEIEIRRVHPLSEIHKAKVPFLVLHYLKAETTWQKGCFIYKIKIK